MKRILPVSLGILYLWTLGACSTRNWSIRNRGSVAAEERIETREQLLFAVNAWMKDHGQTQWTMAEIIGRVADEGFMTSHLSQELALPVEALVVCLVKNRRFTRPIKLRTNQRHEINLQIEKGEITRLRAEWEKVVKDQMSISKVEEKQSKSLRRLPLPAHDTLTLDIFSIPADLRNNDENPNKLNHWGILLASVLTDKKPVKETWSSADRDHSLFVATPKQLLAVINTDRKENHQKEMTRDELLVRVADNAIALKESGDKSLSDVELLVECLIRDKPFIYPMRMSESDADEIFYMHPPEKRLRLLPHSSLSVDILNLPWNSSTERHPLKIDWRTIILSYSFPANNKKENIRIP